MSTHLKVFTLFAILVASIGLTPAFGQTMGPIAVTTDKTSYKDGDTIMISGEVQDLISGTPVALKVIAANGNVVVIDQLDVGADRKFSTDVVAGGGLWKSQGTYTVEVQYGTQARTAQTMFEFSGSTGETPKPSGTTVAVEGTDFMVNYKISGAKLVSVTPDVDANSLIIGLEGTDFGTLTITLPRALIDAKIGDQDDTFFVLVDGEEVDFDETKTSKDRTLTIMFPPGAEEIEIIGTFVIPEFGAIAALILAVAVISIIAVSARSRLSLMPRY